MQNKIDEIIRHYFNDAAYDIDPVPFGLTNLTRILTINGRKYVIRVYNRHTKDAASIQFEARLMAYLTNQELSFTVPVFLNTNGGKPYVQLSDGTLGAVVSFVEGHVPDLSTADQAAELGRVVGELSSALRRYKPEWNDEGTPFTDIYHLHPLADCRAVAAFIDNPPFEIAQDSLHFYKETVANAEQSKREWLDLPKQLVHHDLLIYNLLSIDNRIHGVLDFDFTSLDIGFMEFAISFNHVVQMTNGAWEPIEAFINGYAQYRKSSALEWNQLRLLTRIYHIAVLHIYIGQHYSGVTIEKPFHYILDQFRTRDEWLLAHRDPLELLFNKCLIER
ncbi:phosphotransferase [Paenibacillus arenilitoris]|uniref:Phosphotransferase n=1 Tax=Paenibacillus arenilitoris TaxID=2772299 RepID=A0A927CQF5_9BACL|nr:phosphotransferase [Paenibacillus arenilitoris]MBD2871620.1 phosphotransferase [Paenibacillus arenilitoris]